MIRLHCVKGGRQGETLSFSKDVVTLGRREDNDVAFDPEKDRVSSSRHAEIRKVEAGYVLVDLESSNGTFVNGEKVTRTTLRNGDVVEFGSDGPRIRVEMAEERAATGLPLGHRTVAMMIQAAMSQARAAPAKRGGKTTAFFRAIASEVAHHSTRRLKVLIVLLSGIAFLALLGLGYFVWQEARFGGREELSRTLETQQQEIQRQKQDISAQKAQIEEARKGVPGLGENIAEKNRRAIFLLSVRFPTGREEGFCSGFAADKGVIMTNAHCVQQMRTMAKEGAKFFALANQDPGKRFPIDSTVMHPEYRAGASSPTSDVGLLLVKGDLPAPVPLAEESDLRDLRPGQVVYVYGFPGDLMEVSSPVATITQGIIGRITTLTGLQGGFSDSLLIQHSAFTTKGTSGSPVFDRNGKVVSINSGFYRGMSKVEMTNSATGKKDEVELSNDLSGYAFSVRIDLAEKLLSGLAAGRKE